MEQTPGTGYEASTEIITTANPEFSRNRMHNVLRQNSEVWDLFTRGEEYTNMFRDGRDRFPYYASKNRCIFEPLTSRYLLDNGYSFEYPDNKPFALCITHDVDIIYQGIKAKSLAALSSLIAGQPKEAIDYLLQMRAKKIPFSNVKNILSLEEKYDAKSTFFLLALKPGDPDHYYAVDEIPDEIASILDSGCEIGLHGGAQSYCSFEQVLEQKERLEKALAENIIGYRSHHLKFIVPDTWEILEKAGFKYDATLGYADCAGFRNGMCHLFRPFNLKNDSDLNLVEIPLVIMDNTLDAYMKLDPEKAWKITKNLIDTVERFQGVLSILWHNTSFIDERYELFSKIIDYCYRKNAWLTNCRELVQWYDKYL